MCNFDDSKFKEVKMFVNYLFDGIVSIYLYFNDITVYIILLKVA